MKTAEIRIGMDDLERLAPGLSKMVRVAQAMRKGNEAAKNEDHSMRAEQQAESLQALTDDLKKIIDRARRLSAEIREDTAKTEEALVDRALNEDAEGEDYEDLSEIPDVTPFDAAMIRRDVLFKVMDLYPAGDATGRWLSAPPNDKLIKTAAALSHFVVWGDDNFP